MILMTASSHSFGGAGMPLGSQLRAMHAVAQAGSFRTLYNRIESARPVFDAYGLSTDTLRLPGDRGESNLEHLRRTIVDLVRPHLEDSIYRMRYAESIGAFQGARVPSAATIRDMVEKAVISRDAADMLIDSAIMYLNKAQPMRMRVGKVLMGVGGLAGGFAFFKMLIDGMMNPWVHATTHGPAALISLIGVAMLSGGAVLALTPHPAASIPAEYHSSDKDM